MSDQFTGPLGTMFGTFYPLGYVVAAFDDGQRARQTLEGLQGAGCQNREARLLSGDEVLATHEAFLRQRNLAQRIAGAFDSEERDALEDYLELARQGHHFVIAEAPTEAEIQRALPVLREHGGHKIRHYGRAVITDLS